LAQHEDKRMAWGNRIDHVVPIGVLVGKYSRRWKKKESNFWGFPGKGKEAIGGAWEEQ